MINRQGHNGNLGEVRTKATLSNKFMVHEVSNDIEGRDFLVEPIYSSLHELNESKKRIKVLGIVQAKYFEEKNEVKIAREYVEDIDGYRTDFFTLIHTDSKESDKAHSYFFLANEIVKEFRLVTRKNKEYYVFNISKSRKFEYYKDIPERTICEKIEKELLRTEEYRNEKFIRSIEERILNPKEDAREDINTDLFEKVKDNHIIDQLSICLNSYNDFRRILAWRLISKISFKEKINTSTYYNKFTIHTNHNEILSLFSKIEVGQTVNVKDEIYFKKCDFVNDKLTKIITILNENGIYWVKDIYSDKIIDIRLKDEVRCNSSSRDFDRLNFFSAEQALNNSIDKSANNWFVLEKAYIYFQLGNYESARKVLLELLNVLIANKEEVLSFLVMYNLNIVNRRISHYEEYRLHSEFLKMSISSEKKKILKSISEGTLFNDYFREVDNIYLKIKDYKQRRNVPDTLVLVDRQRTKILEGLNFFNGNWLLISVYKEFDVLIEKYVESCIISYSMRSEFSKHLRVFDDFLIKLILFHCDFNKLLSFFQRNNIKEISYESNEQNFFEEAIKNFFCNDNLEYLYDEITYFDNRTKNPDLRRKVIKIFNNICILLRYLEIQLEDVLIQKIVFFIEKLDLKIHDIAFLAYPILGKTKYFSVKNLFLIIDVLIKNENYHKGYLLMNCLYALNTKEFAFNEDYQSKVEIITRVVVSNASYGALRPLYKLVSSKEKEEIRNKICKILKETFDSKLFSESLISGFLEQPNMFFKDYLDRIHEIISKPMISYSNNCNPYTGINRWYGENLDDLIEVIYVSEIDDLHSFETIKNIKNEYPYYRALLNIDSFKEEDEFNLSWLIENQSDIIFKKLANNESFKLMFKSRLKNNYKSILGEVYLRYFLK